MDSTKQAKTCCSFNPVHILNTGPRLCELKAYPVLILCVRPIGPLKHLTQFCALPIAVAVSCASPVTSFTFTPDCRRVWILSRTNGRGGSQIPTKPTYTKSCRDDPRAIPTTKAKIKSVVYCNRYYIHPAPLSAGTCICKRYQTAHNSHTCHCTEYVAHEQGLWLHAAQGLLAACLSDCHKFQYKHVSYLHCRFWTMCRYSPQIYVWHCVQKWLKLSLTFRIFFFTTKLPYERLQHLAIYIIHS